MATPMAVDSGHCGSSSEEEEESRPQFEIDGNQESNPLIGVPAFSSNDMAEGLSAQFRSVIAIIEKVENWISDSRIGWNQHQCARLASRYTVIAERLRSMYSHENSEYGSSSISTVEAEELLHVTQKWRNLISSYEESQGLTNVICSTNNQEAFEEHHKELDAVLTKLGWQPGTEDTMQGTSETEKVKTFKADAEADTAVMLEKLSQRQNGEKLAKVVSEKTSDRVDVKNLMKGNSEKLPSYLKIACSEIHYSEHVRKWTKKSGQDPGDSDGWARVWKGEWLGGEFAIKVFMKAGAKDDDRAAWNEQQLMMEAGTLVELQHLHVVRLVGFGRDAEQSVFVMELMDNNLRYFMDDLKPEAKFTDRKKLDIIIQIAKGMRFIHAKDYTHGDLKCSNIMVKNYNGQYLEVKIADLRGSQKRGEWNSEAFRQASTTRRPRWTAPEAIDRQTKPAWEDLVMMDIYSFGMTCYEVVSGLLPFQDIKGDPLLLLIRRGGRPELPEKMDAELTGLIQSCWDSVQAQRPQSFEVICERLIAIKSKIDRAVYAPEQLSIPKYLRIEPGQLARGDRIGSGAHARVYKTTWLHCTFAEKKFRKSSLSTTFVQQEIDSLIKISHHPCIAQLVGLSVDKSGEFSIIMEYVDGTLRKLIQSRVEIPRGGGNGTRNSGPFVLHEEVYIISKIAVGMAYLHFWGLVHRDLKTCNVLAEDRFGTITVKIADFGLAHLEESLQLDATTRAPMAANKFYDSWGTGMFRAPEVLPLPARAWKRCCLWSCLRKAPRRT